MYTDSTVGCSRKLKVKNSLLHGHFPMRIIQMSLKIQILGFFIKAKPFPQYDEVLTIIIRNFSVENTNYQYLSIYEKTNNVSYLLAET